MFKYFNIILIFILVCNNSECQDETINVFYPRGNVPNIGINIRQREVEDFNLEPFNEILRVVKRNEVSDSDLTL